MPLLPSPLSPPLTISGQTITLLPSGTAVVVAGPKGTKTADIAPSSGGGGSNGGGVVPAGEALGQALGQAGFIGSSKGGGNDGGGSSVGGGEVGAGAGQPFRGGARRGGGDLSMGLLVGVVMAVGGLTCL